MTRPETGARVVALDREARSRPDETTPLEACLLHAAATLDRPMTLAALHAVQSSEATGTLGVREAVTAAERAGMQAAFGARRLRDFDTTLTPAILLLEGERAVVLHGVGRDGTLAVHDPGLGEGIGEVARDELDGLYTGYAIVLRREHREDILDTSEGRRGHWFWSALAANRWSYTQVLLAAVLANILGLTTSIFIMVVYDRVLPNEATESLIALTVGVGIALIFDFLIKNLRAGFIDRAGARADMAMGRRIFDQLLDMQMRARKGSTGALASTLREFETLRDFFTSATLVAVVDLPFILLFIGVIWLIGGPLALVPAIAVPAGPDRRDRGAARAGPARRAELSRRAVEAGRAGRDGGGARDDQGHGGRAADARPLGRGHRAPVRARHALARCHAARDERHRLHPAGRAGHDRVLRRVPHHRGQVSMGALIASVILTGRALAPLAQLAQTLTRLNQARSSYRSLDALMRADSERPEGRAWISRPRLDGRIRFEDVHFTYPDQMAAALKGVSFTIEPGEKVAILGRIGSGKSTVARMLLGLYAPDKGAVLVDDTDIRQIDPGDLRRNIGSVLQDVWLFSGTVRENIAIGARRPRDADILEAARIAGVEEFVSRHPSGYDLMLAERGEGLSGGQKQAITLARALVGQPPVLLLDEPTSAMDVQNERDVIARLKAEAADRTLVVITHRTSLLDLVDRVIVIEDGRVGADGDKSILSRGARKAAGGPDGA